MAPRNEKLDFRSNPPPIRENRARSLLPAAAFSTEFETVSESFQNSIAGCASSAQCKKLLGAAPGDIIQLADPVIIKSLDDG